jgi:hypothetical protein
LLPFPSRFHDLVAREFDVLHPQPQALDQPQSGSVEEQCHDPRNTVKHAEQGLYFSRSQHHGQALRPLGAHDVVKPPRVAREHLLVEEEEGRERRTGSAAESTRRRNAGDTFQ